MKVKASVPRTRANLLSQINWGKLGTLIQQELHNREIHAPVVSAYRWWARRPHSVMGAILDAAVNRFGNNLTVSDPFSGGGTVTFEAVRRGIKTYAQDLYPWPAKGLAMALTEASSERLNIAGSELLHALSPLRKLYQTSDGRELSHVIRVKSAKCVGCDRNYFLFPQPLISLLSRKADEKHAYFGCAACGSVGKRRRTIATYGCSDCGHRHNCNDGVNNCPHCSLEHSDLHMAAARYNWHAVLVQEVTNDSGKPRARVRKVRADDPVDANDASGIHPLLDALIPNGIETNRLISSNLFSWAALYTNRQATILVAALQHIRASKETPTIKDRLAFAVLGAAEMPAMISRWDRYHLKPFEGTANHRYSNSTLVVESNPISPVGRGTLQRRFKGAVKALNWLLDSCESVPRVQSTTLDKPPPNKTNWDVLVATGSSQSQALGDRSVSVVLTDPPYFSDVQYGELARLFHTWLSIYCPLDAFDESEEAVPNAIRGTSAESYQAAIAACFSESRRTLKANGRLILTFHNKKLIAWSALAGALSKSGFAVRAIAVVRAENSNDHCKRDVKAMLHDLVLECAPRNTTSKILPRLEFIPKTTAEKNLAAVGMAVAASINRNDPGALAKYYDQYLLSLNTKTRLIE